MRIVLHIHGETILKSNYGDDQVNRNRLLVREKDDGQIGTVVPPKKN